MKIKFIKYPDNPVLKPKSETFYSKYTANPDLLLFNDSYYFYFRGQDKNGFDQIGVGFMPKNQFDGINWIIPQGNPIIPVSPDPQDFDSGYILDPASIIVDNHVYLYYTAHRSDWQAWNIPSHIGLAISDDGIQFKKSAMNPVIMGMAPEVVKHHNKIYLLFQRYEANGRIRIYCCPSDDGISFSENDVRPIFDPSDASGSFDNYSISTARLWKEGNIYYMLYGGCNRFPDYPVAIGLARSDDLLNWERYPHNPILTRGNAGDWDEGAVWFATIHKHASRYYLWYEGTGTGQAQSNREAIQASTCCQEEDYGGYGETSFSQIGMATFAGDLTDW